MVVLFADAISDVFSSFGDRIGISPFYISFIFAPLASNASEIIAAYSYAGKKTSKSIEISFSTLLGAGVMNNSVCLGAFLLLIFINGDIAWTFSAETLAIIMVELAVALYAMCKRKHTVFDAIIILMFYPMTLAFVALVEKYTSLD